MMMTTSIYDLFGTDAMLETGGVWVEYGKFGKFLIARSGGANSKYAKTLEAKLRPFRHQLEGKGKKKSALDNEMAEQIFREVFVDSCLMGWEGVTGRDGKEMKYSRDNALKLFKDLPDLFNDLREQSTALTTFQIEEIEEDSGN